MFLCTKSDRWYRCRQLHLFKTDFSCFNFTISIPKDYLKLTSPQAGMAQSPASSTGCSCAQNLINVNRRRQLHVFKTGFSCFNFTISIPKGYLKLTRPQAGMAQSPACSTGCFCAQNLIDVYRRRQLHLFKTGFSSFNFTIAKPKVYLTLTRPQAGPCDEEAVTVLRFGRLRGGSIASKARRPFFPSASHTNCIKLTSNRTVSQRSCIWLTRVSKQAASIR